MTSTQDVATPAAADQSETVEAKLAWLESRYASRFAALPPLLPEGVAASAALRTLVPQIEAAILQNRDMGKAHAVAEITGADDADDLEDVWQNHRAQIDGLLLQALSLPARTEAERRANLEVYLRGRFVMSAPEWRFVTAEEALDFLENTDDDLHPALRMMLTPLATTAPRTHEQIIADAGGPAAFRDRLGFGQDKTDTVNSWARRKKIPATVWADVVNAGLATVEELTGVSTSVSAAAADRSLWDRRMADMLAAKAAFEAADLEIKAIDDRIDEHMPAQVIDHTRRDMKIERWFSPKTFEEDATLSPAAKARLRPIVLQWFADKARLEQEHGYKAAIERQEAAYNAYTDAIEPLIMTPAPDAAAAAWKHLQASIEIDDDRLGYDDLGLVAFHRSHYWAEQFRVALFLDAMRAAGIDHPALHMSDFDPRDWISRFEAAGGYVTYRHLLGLITEVPTGARETESGAASACADLMRDLYEEPWRARAVALSAEHRKSDGGDPRVNSQDDPWPDGPRSSNRRAAGRQNPQPSSESLVGSPQLMAAE